MPLLNKTEAPKQVLYRSLILFSLCTDMGGRETKVDVKQFYKSHICKHMNIFDDSSFSGDILSNCKINLQTSRLIQGSRSAVIICFHVLTAHLRHGMTRARSTVRICPRRN